MVKEFAKYLLGQAAVFLIGFISIKVYTNIFSPELYGEFSYWKSFSAISGVINAGIFSFYIRFGNNEKQEFNNTLVTIFIGLTAVISISFLLYSFFSHSLSKTMKDIFVAGSFSFFFNNIFNGILTILNSKQQAKNYSIINTMMIGLSFCFSLFLIIYIKTEIYFILIGNILASIFLIPLSYKSTRSVTSRFKIEINSKVTRQLIHFGIPLSLGAMSRWILTSTDKLIIAKYCSPEDIAFYSVPASITMQSINILLVAFSLTDRPIIFDIYKKEGGQKASIEITNSIKLFLISICPIFIIFSASSKEIISLLSTEAYIQSHEVITILTAAFVLNGLAMRFQLSSIIKEKTLGMSIITLLSAVLNVVLNFIFIPHFGYTVAAYTTLASSIVYFILNYIHGFYSLRFKIPLKGSFIVTTFSILTILFLKETINHLSISPFYKIILSSFIVIALYVPILIFTNELKGIINIIKQIMKK